MNRKRGKGKGKGPMELDKSTKEKIASAFKTMNTLGIDAETVRPVLIRLLDLYNNEWALIEEDNYRILADAIFEAAEDKAEKGVEDERPLEKADKSKVNGPSKFDGEKSGANSEMNGQIGNTKNKRPAESSQSVPRVPIIEPDHFGRHATKKNKGTIEMLRSSHEKKKGPACNPQNMIQKIQDGGAPGSSSNGGAPGSSHLRPTQESSMVDNQVRTRLKGAVYKDDITNGSEKVKISLLQERGGGDLPKFTYMRSSEIYQSAYVHISLARISNEDCCPGCKGNCISSSLPCTCAQETGGEFAYTPEGLLNPRFLESCLFPKSNQMQYCHDCPLERIKKDKNPKKCQGHLMRTFIKECWKKCGCSMECGNRVVQRGISRKLQIFHASNGKGWGVRTLEKLPAGAFICEYAGEILTNTELYERNKQRRKGRHVYPVLLDSDWTTESVLKDEEALCLDATDYGNIARFMNHRCADGNLIEIPVQIETLDRHYYHVAFFTQREVNALEELTWDYGIDFDDHNHPIEAFQCRCGSAKCRGRAWRPRN